MFNVYVHQCLRIYFILIGLKVNKKKSCTYHVKNVLLHLSKEKQRKQRQKSTSPKPDFFSVVRQFLINIKKSSLFIISMFIPENQLMGNIKTKPWSKSTKSLRSIDRSGVIEPLYLLKLVS